VAAAPGTARDRDSSNHGQQAKAIRRILRDRRGSAKRCRRRTARPDGVSPVKIGVMGIERCPPGKWFVRTTAARVLELIFGWNSVCAARGSFVRTAAQQDGGFLCVCKRSRLDWVVICVHQSANGAATLAALLEVTRIVSRDRAMLFLRDWSFRDVKPRDANRGTLDA